MFAWTTTLLLQLGQPLFVAPTPELRDAQARLESVRRMHLPVEHAVRGRCDQRVGRFCYWLDSTESPRPRLEAARITTERAQLLDRLGDAAQRWPGDPWIAGQRVRYLIDAGRADSAAALPCTSAVWWCAALRGLALHVATRYAASDSSFSIALGSMPAALRCQWTNLSIVLEHPLAHEMQRADCERRLALAGTAWHLSQPLWMIPGNDARSEYLGRRTMMAIVAGTATPHGTRWSDDQAEVLLRYAWDDEYTRSPPTGTEGSWGVTSHDREPTWNLMPSLASLAKPWVARNAWSLRLATARMTYAPRHVTALLELPHQLARLPRADSMQLVVIPALHETPIGTDSVEKALAVFRAGVLQVIPMPGTHATTIVPADTIVVSVEGRHRGDRRAARARYSIAPLACHRAPLCLSDLLLFRGGETATPRDALERPLGASVSAAAPIGVWWHLRAPASSVTMTADVRPERSSARRVAEAVRLARRSSTTRIRWQAAMPSDSITAVVSLRLPAGARGRYRITLTAEARGAPPVSSSRTILVTP